MNLKVGDKVRVIAGSSKGKEGKIIKTLSKENKVIVEGANIVKKHMKGNGQVSGGIQEVSHPIHASNVKLLDSKDKKDTRPAKKEEKETKKTTKSTKKSSAKSN